MRYDLANADAALAYKLLAATVVPRPIAWVVTKSVAGAINAAPFSFFNVMGANPPTIALGLLADPERGFKDTARNILESGQFTVNLVPERLVEQMNLTAIDAPTRMNELQLAGVATEPSVHIGPPRIAASPVCFECVNQASIVTGPHQSVIIGRVLSVVIDDVYLLDAQRGYVNTSALDLVSRSYGAGYFRIGESFELQRPRWQDRKPEA